MSRNIKIEKKAMKLFKCMIEFLQLYGSENYGSSAEVNWFSVYNVCHSYGIFDFNDELEELLNIDDETDSEKFRDAVYTYVEKQVLAGYPVWRLFTMSDWLYNQCEKELEEREWEKDKYYFYHTKCYRCKYFRDEMYWFINHPLKGFIHKPITIGNKDTYPKHNENVQHNMYCERRNQLIDEKIEDYNSKHKSSGFRKDNTNDREEIANKLKYAKFRNDTSNWYRSDEYKLNPLNLKRCPYFEEDSSITPEKFVDTYIEINRIGENKEDK